MIVKLMVVVPLVMDWAVTFVIQTSLFVTQVLTAPTYCKYPGPEMARKLGVFVM